MVGDAELDEGKKEEVVAVDAVKQFLDQAERGKPVAEAVTEKVFVLRREGEKQVMSDTCDRTKDNLVVAPENPDLPALDDEVRQIRSLLPASCL